MTNHIPNTQKKYAQAYNAIENKVVFNTEGETETQTQFQEQQEIANIIRAFTKGLPIESNKLSPVFEDVSEIQDFQKNFETLKQAEMIKKDIDEKQKREEKEKQEKEQNELKQKLEKLEKYENDEKTKKSQKGTENSPNSHLE